MTSRDLSSRRSSKGIQIGASSLGEITANTKGKIEAPDHKFPSVIFVDLYMAPRQKYKKSSLWIFDQEAIQIYHLKLKAIGMMKKTRFIVDIVGFADDEEDHSYLPPLGIIDARDLARAVREAIDTQLTSENRTCSAIPVDVLDLTVAGEEL